MAKEGKVFLKRVYDKFVSVDWKVGQADLNPLREMNYFNVQQTDEDLNALRAAIAEQVEKTKALLEQKGIKPRDTLAEDDNSETINFNSGGNAKPENLAKSSRFQAQVGSTKGTLFNTNFHQIGTQEPDPLLTEIDDLILTFAPIIIDSEDKNKDESFSEDPRYNFAALPLGPLCSTEMVNGAIKETNATADSEDANNDNNEEDTPGAEGNDGEDYLNELLKAREEADALAAQALADFEKQKEDTAASLETCALSTLGILKVIAIIIQITSIFKMIISYVLGILVPIMEIVTLAAGLWVCPAGAGEIVMKLVQTALGIIVKIVCQIIAELWKMVNTNCIVKSSLATLDGIQSSMGLGLKALSDTGSAFSMMGEVARVIEQFKDQLQDMGEQAENAKQNLKEEAKKEWEKIGEQSLDELKESGLQIVETALGPIQEQIKQYEQTRDAVLGAIDEIKGSWGGMADKMSSMTKSFKRS